MRYRDASEDLGVEAHSTRVEYAPVVAWERDGRWVFGWLSGEGPTYRSLDGAIVGAIRDSAAGRFLVRDLDGDGSLDLLRWGGRIEVTWSFQEAPDVQALANNEEKISQGLECGWISVEAGDLDGDGLLDLFVPAGDGCGDDPQPLIYRQGPGRQFEVQSIALGDEIMGATFDAYILDLDGDGDTDIYACNDFGWEIRPNQVLTNDGSGALAPGDARGADVATNCMSTSFGDLDGDGLLDLYVGGTNYQYVLLDSAIGYIDYRASWGVPVLSEPEMPWGTAVLDYDNDGRFDLLVSSSEHSYVQDNEAFAIHLYRQEGPGSWAAVDAEAGLPQQTSARGLLARDFNGDGVLDILAADMERSPWLLLSEGCTAASWLELRAPEGSIARVMAGGVLRTGLVTGHPGFGGYGPPSVHFGLGDADEVDWVTIEVPRVGTVALKGPIAARRRIEWSPVAAR